MNYSLSKGLDLGRLAPGHLAPEHMAPEGWVSEERTRGRHTLWGRAFWAFWALGCRSGSLPSILLAALLISASIPREIAAEPLSLVLGAGELGAGEVRHHEMVLTPGRSAWVVVEQLGIDLILEIHGPQGRLLAEVDSPLERFGLESAVLQDPPAGRLKVSVRSAWQGVARGRYRISVETLETEALDSRTLDFLTEWPAEVAWTQGASRFAASGIGRGARQAEETPGVKDGTTSMALEEALQAFGKAARLFGEAGSKQRQAESLQAQGRIHRHLGRSPEARELFRQATEIWRALGSRDPGSRLGEAMTRNDLGLTAWDLGELSEAEGHFQGALEGLEGLGEESAEAEIQQNLCLIAHARGDLNQAVDCYAAARDRFRHLGELRWEGIADNNLGYAYFALGEPTPAIASYQRALEIQQAVGDRAGQGQALNNLAVVYRGVGEIQEALALYDRAKTLQEDLGDQRRLAATLSNLGAAYRNLGEAERARSYFIDALALRRQFGDGRGEVSTLGHLGQLRCDEGEYPAGLALLHRALDLAKEVDGGRRVGSSLVRLAHCRLSSGDARAARLAFEDAIRLLDAEGDGVRRAEALQGLARAMIQLGMSAQAVAPSQESLRLRLGAGDLRSAAISRVTLARAYREQGELSAALREVEAALETIEVLRHRLASPDLRASFFAAQREAFEVQAGALVELHRRQPSGENDWRAFQVSERARARSLTDLLEDSGAQVAKSLSDPSLLGQRQELRRRLYLKTDRQRRAPLPGPQSAGKEVLESEIVEIQRQLDLLEARLRQGDRRYATLVAPPAVARTEIAQLLGTDTLLLEVLLAEPKSLLWAVDGKGLTVHDLPGRAEIEATVAKVYEGWSILSADPATEARAAQLASWLLGPVAEKLATGAVERIVIVADGALHLLPFAALPVGDSSRGILLDHFELVSAPSAASILARRSWLAAQPEGGSRALVLADPVFDDGDPRLAALARPVSADDGAPRLRSRGENLFPRLSYSRGEAVAIAELDAESVDVLLGFDARVESLLTGDLSRYRFLHVASHGLVDAVRPELGGLLLSRRDAQGRSLEGWLRLADIYDLRLSAELVVLSGCRTAMGRQLRGEGLLGLSRGFLHAGSRSVAASLWALQDRAAAELMESLYRHLWKSGLRPAAALRQAQLDLRSQHRWKSPFYWAPWVLQGDWQ